MIFITATQERKDKLLQQLQELKIPFAFYFLEASKIPDSESWIFLPGATDEYQKRQMCCTRSHFRAIEYASRDTSADFSIIIEDDAAFHKTEFVPKVLSIINEWNSIFGVNHDMVSLGWLPEYEINNYAVREGTYKSLDKFKFLPGSFYLGTQGYIIKKETAIKFTPLLFKPSLYEVVMAIEESDVPNKHLITEYRHIDQILIKILRGCPIYPHLIIEQKDNKSIIGEHSGGTTEVNYWKPFFKGFEEERKNYWSY